MANELINVPNFGLEFIRVYLHPQKIMVDFARKHKVSYYFLEYIYKKNHRDMPVKYAVGVKILNDVAILAEQDEFKRFIKKTHEFVEFKWKNKIRYVIPFDCFEVSVSMIGFMEFKGYTRKTSLIGGRFMDNPVKCDDVITHLKYMISQQSAHPADFDVYIDSWMKRLLWECKNHEEEIIRGKAKDGQDSIGENSK